jgi:hypothetical protein
MTAESGVGLVLLGVLAVGYLLPSILVTLRGCRRAWVCWILNITRSAGQCACGRTCCSEPSASITRASDSTRSFLHPQRLTHWRGSCAWISALSSGKALRHQHPRAAPLTSPRFSPPCRLAMALEPWRVSSACCCGRAGEPARSRPRSWRDDASDPTSGSSIFFAVRPTGSSTSNCAI